MWCRVDKKCLTRLEAAAAGTLCGTDHVILLLLLLLLLLLGSPKIQTLRIAGVNFYRPGALPATQPTVSDGGNERNNNNSSSRKIRRRSSSSNINSSSCSSSISSNAFNKTSRR